MLALSVVIADDHQLVRNGLKQLLAQHSDLRVIADCASGAETLRTLSSQHCHALLLDLSMADMSGIDVLRHVRNQHPSVGVLVVSGFPERQFGINVLRAGAHGFISKGADDKELLRAIRTVARGGRYVGPDLADLLLGGDADGDELPRAPHMLLSDREFQIFCKLAEGRTVSEIAEKLFLSVKTISTYRSRILEKMSMLTNADLTSYALRHQLIQ